MEPWKLEPAHDFGLPLSERLRSGAREDGFLEAGGHLAWWTLVQVYLRTVHRLTIEGREHLPAVGPFILVSNHQSHLDALVLAAPLPWRVRQRTYPIAAADAFFDSSLTGAFAAAATNALPMSRGRPGVHALRQLRERLVGEKCVYILFPEGTRSRDGSMGSFKAGAGMLLAGSAVPAIPCHVAGTFEALPPNGRIPRPVGLRLRIGQPLTFERFPNSRGGWNDIAGMLEAAVRALAGA